MANTAATFIARFGESITAIFADSTTRTISAVVNRDPVAPVPEMTAAQRPLAFVFVRNSATLGISSSELDTATLRLSFPRRLGKAAETFRVHRLIEQDADMIALEVR